MARKSRKLATQEVKQQEQKKIIETPVMLPQMATAAYARLSVDKKVEESIQTQISMLHQ